MRYIILSILFLNILFGQLVVLHQKGKVFWQKNNQEKVLLKRLDTVWYYGAIIFEDNYGYIALYNVKTKKALELNSNKEKYYNLKSLFIDNENSLQSSIRYVLSHSTSYYSGRIDGITLGAVSRGLPYVSIITPNKNMFYRDSIFIHYHKYKNATYYEINLLDYNGNLVKKFFTRDTFIHIKYDSLLSDIYYYYEIHPFNGVNNPLTTSQYRQSFFVVSREKEFNLMNKEREIIDLCIKTKSFKHFYQLVSFYYNNSMYDKMINLLDKYHYSLYVSLDKDLILVKNVISCAEYTEPIVLYSDHNNVYFYISNTDFFVSCNWCSCCDIFKYMLCKSKSCKYHILIVIEDNECLDIIEHWLEVM